MNESALIIILAFLYIATSVGLMSSKDKVASNIGKIMLGIILTPILIAILLFVTCLVFVGVGGILGSVFH